MPTHDYIIDNQTAPAFRADLNQALQAIVSNNSNPSAPTITYANMIWYDTTNKLLRMRNEADDAFITLGTLDQVAGTFVVQNNAPLPQSGGGLGQFRSVNPSIGVAAVLPAGGTWAFAIYRFSSGVVSTSAFGISAGGSTVGAAAAGQNWSGFAWRIT